MKKITLFAWSLWQGVKCPPGGNCPVDEIDDLKILISNIANVALALISTVALIFLIIGGFQYIMSAGNPDQISKAKSTILYSIIGLVLAIAAFAIISFISSKF